jgi:zinc finger CCHC domain-containing protein 9
MLLLPSLYSIDTQRRCGSKKHSLSKCPRPVPEDVDKRLPFASCFVCQGKGHLAGQCPENKAKGVYPNGGCCKVCGQTDHLARDCGLRQSGWSSDLISPNSADHATCIDVQKDRLLVGQGRDAGADEDDFHVVSRRKKEVDAEEGAEAKPKGKIKRLVGGKIIIRVEDEPPKPKPVAKPAAPEVKTVYF